MTRRSADNTRPRCHECGRQLATWTPAAIIAACQQWDETHGEPPACRDWRNAAPHHPAESTCRAVFGSWNKMMAAAGYEPRRAEHPRPWTREQILFLILKWHFIYGSLPKWADWHSGKRGAEYPSAYYVAVVFGSWNAAIVAAGYEPTNARRTIESYRHEAGVNTRMRDERGRLLAA